MLNKQDLNRVLRAYDALTCSKDMTDPGSSEYQDLVADITKLVEAKSDRAAGKLIEWWDCWDSRNTPTAFARKIRVAVTTGTVSIKV